MRQNVTEKGAEEKTNVAWDVSDDGLSGTPRGRPDLRVDANAFRWRVVEIATGKLLVERVIEDHEYQRSQRRGAEHRGWTKVDFAVARAESWLETRLGIARQVGP